MDYGRAHRMVRNSWEAGPGDIVLFDWDGDNVADHTEIATADAGGTLFTVGGKQRAEQRRRLHRRRRRAPPSLGL